MGLGGYSEGSGEKMSEMTGLERLRALGREQEERSWSTVGKVRGRLMLQIAEQIESEQVEAAADHAVVASVASEMELHCLGHEGMEDSPVARWARELREALGGRSDEVTDVATIRKDAMEAYEWVEAHGGLDAMVELSSRLMTIDALRAAVEETCTRLGVEHTGDLAQDAQAIWREIGALRSRLKESVPRAAYERHLARLQRQIDESHAALRRRNERIEELGHRVNDLTTENAELRRRAMPEGCEWPRYEDGEPVKPGSWLQDNDGEAFEAVSFVFTCAWWGIRGYRPDRYGTIGTKYRRQLDGMAYGAPVKRPAVLAADGEPLEGGQTVWHIETGAEYWVKSGQTITADAVVIIRKTDCDCESEIVKASQLTHTKPEIDSWERLKSDIYKEIEMQPTLRTTKCGIESFVSDVVRRCKALAERERGE